MLIGNTILGLAKLVRLMRLAKAKKRLGEDTDSPVKIILEHLANARIRKQARTGKIRLQENEFPVRAELVSMLFIKSRDSIANSNNAAKATASARIAGENNFAARVATNKANESGVVR